MAKITIKYKNQFAHVYCYEEEKQWDPWIKKTNLKIDKEDKFKVSIQPYNTETIIETDDIVRLWHELRKLHLSEEDRNPIYDRLRLKLEMIDYRERYKQAYRKKYKNNHRGSSRGETTHNHNTKKY